MGDQKGHCFHRIKVPGKNHFKTLTFLSLHCLHGGGRAVYSRGKQIGVIRVSAVGNFSPDLLVAGHDRSQYTVRPPKAPSHFRAGLVQYHGMNDGIIPASRVRGVGRCTNRVMGEIGSKTVFSERIKLTRFRR